MIEFIAHFVSQEYIEIIKAVELLVSACVMNDFMMIPQMNFAKIAIIPGIN